MTCRDALHYGAILATILAACILLSAMDAPRQLILPVADRPRAAGETVRRVVVWAEGELVSLGTFTVYAYCDCERCCGQWSGGPTASGTMPEAGRTVAADWDVLPAGTEIYIADLGQRVVEDTGSGIAEDKLDVFMDSHEAAVEFGVREMEVWVYEQRF